MDRLKVILEFLITVLLNVKNNPAYIDADILFHLPEFLDLSILFDLP